VCTSKGAEGLGLIDGSDALIADDPQSFAQRVLQVLSNAHLRSDLAERGAQTVAARFDWRLIGRDLLQFVDQVAGAAA
jgi:glycosyltransferase involved in cell wall biosynthesis